MRSILFASFLGLVASCGGGKKAPTMEHEGGALVADPGVPGLREGALWSCQISDYDPQPCKVTRTGEGWHLAKLLGSQRFRGSVAVDGGTDLAFDGEFFCPWGDCTQAMQVEFRLEEGSFVTDFGGDRIQLRYDEALEQEWGGAGYGGLTGDEQ